MGTNVQFVEDFTKRSIRFSVAVIEFCNELPRSIASQVIVHQLIRCTTSIGANFVESQAAHSRKDFSNFLQIALKSANETTYWIRLLREAKIGTIHAQNILFTEAQELANILGSIVKKLRA